MSGIKCSKGDSRRTKKKRKKLDDIFVKSQEGALFRHFKRLATTTVTSDGSNLAPGPLSAAALHVH